jgi:predicted dinucleotide-binding enzyme
MNIAIIGTGNIGGTLAIKWAKKGHQINIGVRDLNNFKGKQLLESNQIQIYSITEAVQKSEVILMATPAMAAKEVSISLGNTSGKIIIDAANIVMGRGPAGFLNVSDCILANTQSKDLVKCFNSTGFNNIENPVYQNIVIDMFMAGDSVEGKKVAKQLALDAGFEQCYDIGGNDKFTLLEQFAFFWINLAMFQGQGREMAFKLLKR